MEMPVYLIEIDMLDPAGQPVALYVSTIGYNTRPTDTPPNRHYAERVVDAGSFRQSLFGGGRTIGTAEPGYGEIVLSNADNALSWILDCAMDGRPLRIMRLPGKRAAYSSAVTVLSGKAEAPRADDALRTISIGIYNRMLDLDKPLQSARYAGTTVTSDGTIEGNEDLKGTVKPLTFGRVRNVEPPCVNVHQWLYQVSTVPVSEVLTYDGGSPRNPAGNFATVAAALSASALYGRVATCFAEGIIRFVGNASASPRYVLTADVKEGATLADRYPGAVARRMLAQAGVAEADIDVAAFDALDAAAPREVGIHVADEETSRAAIARVLASVGAYLLPDAQGRFTTGRLAFGTPVARYDINDPDRDAGMSLTLNPDSENGVPPWRIIMRYQPLYRTLDKSNVAGCVDTEMKAYLTKEWREITDEDDALHVRHPRSQELTIETRMDKAADVEIELARVRGLLGVNRYIMPITVPWTEAAPIGSTVTLELPRLGFEGGRDMIAIDRDDDFTRDRVTMMLWG